MVSNRMRHTVFDRTVFAPSWNCSAAGRVLSSRAMPIAWRATMSAIVLLAAACADHPKSWTEKGPVAAGITCHPLDSEWDCLYPYPSDLYLKPDATLPGRQRLEVPPP